MCWCAVCCWWWCIVYRLLCIVPSWLTEEGHFPLPPPPDHPPPPLRRSTLDLMELMREETHHSSQGKLGGGEEGGGRLRRGGTDTGEGEGEEGQALMVRCPSLLCVQVCFTQEPSPHPLRTTTMSPAVLSNSPAPSQTSTHQHSAQTAVSPTTGPHRPHPLSCWWTHFGIRYI